MPGVDDRGRLGAAGVWKMPGKFQWGSYRLDAFGRKGISFSARDARFRVCTHTSPLPVNFITRPSPPAMSDRIPPTLPMDYSTSSVNATTWPVSTTNSLPGSTTTFLMAPYEL